MKFPVTRESLQQMDFDKYVEQQRDEEIQKRITALLEQICEEFERYLSDNLKKKQFIFIKRIKGRKTPTSVLERIPDTYIPLFTDKLKELFVGCDITIHPSKSHLIIDWS